MDTETYDIYMFPSPDTVRRPLLNLNDSPSFPEPLRRAYAAAIDAHNARLWPAAAVLCGRLLEGMLHHILKAEDSGESLATQLQKLPEKVDLAEPILRLADSIRKGRNLGAHFDLEREPDHETVGMMLDFVENFIEYLVVLPERVETLHERLGAARD